MINNFLLFLALIDAQATCTYQPSKLKVTCSNSRTSVTCDTQSPSGGYSAPPAKTYLIETMRIHTELNREWFNLNPKKSTSSGYWDYYSVDPDTGRSTIGLHPGTISHGCVTILDSNCWIRLRDVLKSVSAVSSTVTRYNKWLPNYDMTISTLGTLTVY